MSAEAVFGSQVRQRRDTLGLTRKELAQRVGCSMAMIRKIESGERHPSRQMAELLARALTIPEWVPTPDGPTPHSPPTNLPAPLTSFVDRAHELTQVQAKLLHPDVRLLTLLGPPGIGKTRLSIQAAQRLLSHFADGAWFVALAPITDPTLVLLAIAHTFNITEAGPTPLAVRVQDFLRPKQMLLVFDNFEQVLDAVPIVSDLLKASPRLKVIATSRKPLDVYGEHEYPIPALSLPPRNKRLAVEQLAQYNAIKLFVARAEAVQPGFTLNAETAQAVADICLRLDGVPLAIELAASRLRQFTLLKLRDALNDTLLQALVGTTRDVEPRLRTLRNAIQWSYDLLDIVEQVVFVHLGVFVGGCTTEAALAVCELTDDASLHILADQNLLQRDANGRWTMLEMIHEFAQEALAQSFGVEHAREQHAEYFAHVLKPGGDEVYKLIDVEQHNARAALRWLLDHKDPLILDLAQCMGWYFQLACLPSEGQRVHHDLLAAGIEMTPLLRYHWLSGATIFASQHHDFKAALRYTQEALSIARAMDWQSLIADGLIDHGMVYLQMGDYTQVKQVALEALGISRRIQDSVQMVGALVELGAAELAEGDVNEAEAYYTDAYTLCQAPDWWQHVYATQACKGMGEVALSRREYDPALRFLREGLERSKFPVLDLWILDLLAGVIGTMSHRTIADIQRAAKIWGAVEVQREMSGLMNAPDDRRRTDALIAQACSRIAPKIFATAWTEGRDLSLDEAIALTME